jgi:transcription elongation factor S-II
MCDTHRHRATALMTAIVGQEHAAQIETAAFAYCTEYADSHGIDTDAMFNKLYVQKAIELVENLDPEAHVKNTYLHEALASGAVAPASIPYMTPAQMFPALWQSLTDNKRNRDELKYASRQEATTDAYTCSKCKSRSCTSYEMQTRSIDEPSTVFVTCIECGHNWRYN